MQKQAHALVGTGANGIGAQIRLDRAYKMGEPYDIWQFEKLRNCMGFAIQSKYNKLRNKIYNGKGTVKDQTAMVILESSIPNIFNTPIDNFINILKDLTAQLPSVEISSIEIKKTWDKIR